MKFPLPAVNQDRGRCAFSGTDSRARFQEHSQRRGPEWPWHHQPVCYSLNSQGYRCPEFHGLDWQHSWALVGCSWAFGVGVSDDQTLDHYLKAELGEPVANISQGGTSVGWAWAQITALLQHSRPRGIFVVWTELTRCAWWGSEGSLQPQQSQDLFLAHAADELHSDTVALQQVENTRLLCSALGVPLVEATWNTHTATVLSVTLLERMDLARDCQHPGPLSHHRAAQILRDLRD